MVSKDIFQIKLGPLPKKWGYHDMPLIANDKIDETDNSTCERPSTKSDKLSAFDGVHFGLQNYDNVSR